MCFALEEWLLGGKGVSMDRIRDYLKGTYGFDSLSCALLLITVLLDLIALIIHRYFYRLGNEWVGILGVLSLLPLVAVVFRTFSKHKAERKRTNDQFVEMIDPAFYAVQDWEARSEERKVYKFYKCPSCHQELRVPRGKGRIEITCPNCGEKFIKTS